MRWLARLAQEIKPPQIHPLWILNPGTPPKTTLNLPTMAAEVIILSDMIHLSSSALNTLISFWKEKVLSVSSSEVPTLWGKVRSP